MKNKILLFLLIAGSFFLFLHPIDSGDFFNHIVTGRYIAENWSLPFTDTLTFSAYGKSWIAHSWGSGLLYFVIYQMFGIPGINIFFALSGAATVAFLILLTRKYTSLSLFVFIFLWLATGILSFYWPTRPLVLGPLLLTILLLLLKIYKKYWYLLPLFFFIWNILYGASALLGLIVFALYLLCQKNRWNKKNIFVWLLSFLALYLNGYGLKSLFYGFSSNSYMQAQEWLPVYKFISQPLLPSAEYQIITYFGWLGIVSLMFIYILKNHRDFFKKYFFESVLALGIFGPFISFRFISLAPILTFPFILLSLQLLSGKLKIFSLWGALFFTISVLVIRLIIFPFGFGIKNEKPLQDLVSFMRQHGIYGNVYTNQDLGGYVSWAMPESKVFVDTRDDLFVNTKVFIDRNAVYNGTLPITKLLDLYHANIVIGKQSAIYTPLLQSPQWQLVYHKEYFVAIRKSE